MVVAVVVAVVGGGRDETENEVFFCTIILQPQKVFILETNGPELRGQSDEFREGFYAEEH